MFVSQSMKRVFIATALSSSLIVAGCSNPVSDVKRVFTGVPTEKRPGMTDEQFRLVQLAAESEKIRGQATLAGLGAGAALGVLFCEDTFSACTAVATAAGAAVGYFAGYYVAQKKEDAEAEQIGLNQSITGAKASQAFYQQRVDAMKAVVAQNRARIRELNDSSVATEAQRKAYAEQLSIMEEDLERMEAIQSQVANDIIFMEAEIKGRKDFKNEDTAQLERELAELEGQNAELEEQIASLNSAFETVPEEVRDEVG